MRTSLPSLVPIIFSFWLAGYSSQPTLADESPGGNLIAQPPTNRYLIPTVPVPHTTSIDLPPSVHFGAVTSVVLVLSGDSVPNPVLTNAGFELGMEGWTVSGHQTINDDPAYGVSEGTRCALFNAGNTFPDGSVAQTFSTVAGRQYIVQFDAGSFSPIEPQEQRLEVVVQGSTRLLFAIVSVIGTPPSTIFSTRQYSFVADGPEVTLRFRDVSRTTYAVDLLLDNIRVTAAQGQRTAMSPTCESQRLCLKFPGRTGQSYGLLRSTDLTNWTRVGTVVAPETGTAQYEDLETPGSCVYYRTVTP